MNHKAGHALEPHKMASPGDTGSMYKFVWMVTGNYSVSQESEACVSGSLAVTELWKAFKDERRLALCPEDEWR